MKWKETMTGDEEEDNTAIVFSFWGMTDCKTLKHAQITSVSPAATPECQRINVCTNESTVANGTVRSRRQSGAPSPQVITRWRRVMNEMIVQNWHNIVGAKNVIPQKVYASVTLV